MDKMKGYVLLMINAGVRSSVSERKKSLIAKMPRQRTKIKIRQNESMKNC
jgi:hypothetical protein